MVVKNVNGKGGAPPDGHPNQCRAMSRVTRVRCKRWALRGANNCQFHGGNNSFRITNNAGARKLPMFYSKYLGPKLSQRVLELMNAPHDEQVSLYEELALARSGMIEALQLAAPLQDVGLAAKLSPEIKALMIQTLNESMKNVKELTLAASKLEKDASDKVSIKVINLIVQQIVVAINDVCGTENVAIAEAIAMAIDNRVRLPLNDKLNPKIHINVLPTIDAVVEE